MGNNDQFFYRGVLNERMNGVDPDGLGGNDEELPLIG